MKLMNEETVKSEEETKQCQWCFQDIVESEYYARFEGLFYHTKPKDCFNLFDENRVGYVKT